MAQKECHKVSTLSSLRSESSLYLIYFQYVKNLTFICFPGIKFALCKVKGG